MQGSSRLIIEAVVGVTDIVEAMHRNIAGLAPIVGRSRQGGTRGITGLVYRSVRHEGGECIAAFKPQAVSIPMAGAALAYVWDGERITKVYEKSEVLFDLTTGVPATKAPAAGTT